MVYALDKKITKKYEDLLQLAHITVEHIEPESIAVTRSVLPDVAYTTSTIIDIGEEVTHCITLHNGYPILSQIIPLGTFFLLQGTTGTIRPQELQKTSSVFAEQIKNRLDKAIQYLKENIASPHDIHDIRIVGGGALHPNLIELLQTQLRRPLAVGVLATPLNHPDLPGFEMPLYVHAIGSALRELHTTGGLSLVPLVEPSEGKNIGLASSPFMALRTNLRKTLLGIVFILLALACVVILRAVF